MNDYCNGIAYATGYFASKNGVTYLVVRNLDSFYPAQIASASKYKVYASYHFAERDGKPQYTIKARDIQDVPKLSEIKEISAFCRAYIEIHGIIDMATSKSRDGTRFKKPRLRIYGSKDVISFINEHLPAGIKTVQTITNSVDANYTGTTYAIYYQSTAEICSILKWLDGEQKNKKVWEKWGGIINDIR